MNNWVHGHRTTATAEIFISHNLSAEELRVLLLWSESKRAVWPSFCTWLGETLCNEFERRDQPGCEPGMVAMPCDWNASQVGEALEASFVMVRQIPLSKNQAKWVDELHLMQPSTQSPTCRECEMDRSKIELIDATELCNLWGISDFELKRLINQRLLPPPLRLGLRRRVWLRIDITETLERLRNDSAPTLVSESGATGDAGTL